MPTSVAVAALGASMTGVASVLAFGTTAAFTFSWGAFASSLVMSGLSAALRPDAPEQSSGAASITSGARTVTLRQPIMSWRVIYGRTRVGGGVTYKKVTGTHNTYHLVLTLACHPCEEIEAIYFGEDELSLDVDGWAGGKYTSHVRVYKSLGTEAGQPFPDLVTSTDGEWSDAHRQTGHTKIYVWIGANNNLFPSGLPNISAIVKGRNDIYDPRTGLTGYSANVALCVNNYLTDATRGIGAIYGNEINAAELIAAANTCDETITKADGTTEPRYTCNGTITLSEKPVDIIPKLASAMAGYVVKVGSTWSIHAGAYDTPTLELTESDLAGAISWQSLVSRRDSCNGVKGIYIEPSNLWQPGDFPPVVSDTAVADDNGEQVWHDLRLEFTDSGSMAQRIAKIDLLRTRQPLTVSFPGKLSAFRAVPGKTVLLTIEKYGWSSKPFWVAEGTFSVNADGTLGYHLSLRETAPEIYDWNTDEESPIDLAPNTDMGDPFTVAAPGVPTVTETLYETTGSAGVKARARMSWAASSDAAVVDYFPEWRAVGGDWTVGPATPGLWHDIDDIAPGSYEFRLRQRNGLGVRSAYGGTRTKEIVGLTALPADPQDFYLVAVDGGYEAEWTLSADLDVRIGGRAVIRHTPATSGATWSDGIVVREFNGDAVEGRVPMMAGTYMLKFKDSTGNWSDGMASFVPSEAMLTGYSTAGTSTQHSGFTGTKTGCAVIDGTLQIAGTTLIDDMADLIDDWPKLDGLGGIAAAASYAFDTYMDLATVAARRFDATITAVAFDTGDLIDDRTALIDDWDDFDGNGDINDCDATLWISTTDDDPAGSPTWGAWTPFFVGEFVCRAARFRFDMVSGNPTHTLAVSALSVRARIPT